MPKWEYAQIEKRHESGSPGGNPQLVVDAWGISWPGEHGLGEIFPKLNELGNQGWELVSDDTALLYDGSQIVEIERWTLKRQIP